LNSDLRILERSLEVLSKTKFKPQLDLIRQIAASIERGEASIIHGLAEVLISHYLMHIGWFVEVEAGGRTIKCDILARKGASTLCVEIESAVPPIDDVGAYLTNSIRRIIRKIVNAGRSGMTKVAFAFPVGTVPLIPLALLRPPQSRSIATLRKIVDLASIAGSIDEEEAINHLKHAIIPCVLFYDLENGVVESLQTQAVESLITSYLAFFSQLREELHRLGLAID